MHHDAVDALGLQLHADRRGAGGIDGAAAQPPQMALARDLDRRDLGLEAVEDAAGLGGDDEPSVRGLGFAVLGAELDQEAGLRPAPV